MRTTPTLSVAIVLCLGCHSDPKPGPAPQPTVISEAAPAFESTPSAPTPQPAAAAPSESDRDPFAQPAVPKIAPPTNDLTRKAKKYSVDELRVDHFTGWRVDRIRSGDVVLVREDATLADQTAETRVLALHASPEPLEMDD